MKCNFCGGKVERLWECRYGERNDERKKKRLRRTRKFVQLNENQPIHDHIVFVFALHDLYKFLFWLIWNWIVCGKWTVICWTYMLCVFVSKWMRFINGMQWICFNLFFSFFLVCVIFIKEKHQIPGLPFTLK